jgi:hypothetical protein
MAKFAVLDDKNILNIIVADSKEIAEEVTGRVCVEFTTEMAEPGGTYDGVDFIQKKLCSSWILNANKQWEPPIPRPSDTDEFYHVWDEESVSWSKHLI